MCQSPYVDAFCHYHTVRIIIDSGATCNMILSSTVKRLGAYITTSSQSAHQADGHSPLEVVGETHITLTRDSQQLHFEGLVVENFDVEVLAGTVFRSWNSTISPSGWHDAQSSFVAICTNTDQAKPSHLIQRSDARLFSELPLLLSPFGPASFSK